jgi:hypothetical protein
MNILVLDLYDYLKKSSIFEDLKYNVLMWIFTELKEPYSNSYIIPVIIDLKKYIDTLNLDKIKQDEKVSNDYVNGCNGLRSTSSK